MNNKLAQGAPIICKYEVMTAQLYHLSDRTKAIVSYVTDMVYHSFSCIPIWTSFIRDKKSGEKPSVHHPEFRRGADMARRVIDMKAGVHMRNLTSKEIQAICANVNKVFPYGKGKIKSAIYHRVKGNEYHFHFQSKHI